MSATDPKSSPVPGVDFDAARDRKHTLGLAATPAERLAWLEQAIHFAHRAGALPRPRPANDDDSGTVA